MTGRYRMPEGHCELDKSKRDEKEVRVPCRDCNHATRHAIVASFDTEVHVAEGDFTVWEQFQIIQCSGCDLPSFREDYQSTEEFSAGEDGEQELQHHERLYPPRVVGRAILEDAHLLPEAVHRIYRETHAALCNELMALATVGVRALIEAICNEKGACGQNLVAKIDDLHRLGVLTQSAAALLHRNRSFGNLSAHEIQPADPEVLSTCFAVVENLLQSVYIFPEKMAQDGG